MSGLAESCDELVCIRRGELDAEEPFPPIDNEAKPEALPDLFVFFWLPGPRILMRTAFCLSGESVVMIENSTSQFSLMYPFWNNSFITGNQ